MSEVRAHISISLNGYVAGPNQTQDEPLGEGGEQLHECVFALKAWREPHGIDGGEDNVSNRVVAEENANVGAEIMGRGKYGPREPGTVGRRRRRAAFRRRRSGREARAASRGRGARGDAFHVPRTEVARSALAGTTRGQVSS